MNQEKYAAIALGMLLIGAPVTVMSYPVVAAISIAVAVACVIKGRLWDYEEEGR